MHKLEGYVYSTKPNHIFKLSKSIYGLKRAPRAWFGSLKLSLLNCGSQNTKSDVSLFTLKGKSYVTFLLIYMDDFTIIWSNPKFLQAFIQ